MRPLFNASIGLALATSSALAQENLTTETIPPVPAVAPVLSQNLQSDEPEVTLETLIQRALENSPRLQIARENLAAAQSRGQSARSLPGPILQLVPGWGGNSNARDEEILLSQRLDVFGLRQARGRVASANTRRAEAESRLAARGLEVEVKSAAAQLFAAQEAERLESMQVEIAQQFRDAAAKRAALGDVPGVQVQRADLELLRGQNNLAIARSTRLVRRSELNTLLGDAPNSPLRVTLPLDAGAVATLRAQGDMAQMSNGTAASTAGSSNSAHLEGTSTTSPSPSLDDSLLTSDLMARPDLARVQATIEARQAQVKALRRERLPQIELQARRAPFLGRDGGATALRAVVTIPLFDLGTFKGERLAAEAEAQAQTATLKLLQQRAAGQVESARVQVQSRRESALRYQNQLVPLALDLLRKTQIGYAQGASTYLEVLEAQRTLRQLQTEYLQALLGVQTSEVALDAAINGGFEELEVSSQDYAPQYTLRGEAQ